MAKPTRELVDALRATALRLQNGAHYAWGHHGSCNCGHLLQVLTRLDEKEILTYAHTAPGEWTELAAEFCGIIQAPVSLLVKKLMEAGLTPTDIHHLEYLTDRTILERLPGGFRWLQRNRREDVIVYMETFANWIEEQMPPDSVNSWLRELTDENNLPLSENRVFTEQVLPV
ncbi:MAG: hypothetical protein IM571_10500 [Chitinophagaceae bacterium]|nr:hypothetical protein [Chitinophagaceae bacterium]MCA6470603.1 hypothetical protein [Chitinophagaceae bacterium]MCA6478366.1 hypothetical protein [Chitinophagaceae bacterium]MCA6479482.1 hypothetical protein [Chitinophagaceae bacterium]